jgi:hypothetical protein
MRTFVFLSLVALAGCGRTHRIDPAMAALIPPDTQVLAGVRVDEVRASPLVRKLPFVPAGVHELLLANDGKDTLLIARGALDGAVAHIAPDLSLAGSGAMARAAVARHQSGQGSESALVARAEALPADAQIWAVSAGWAGLPPAVLQQWGNAANLNRILQSAPNAELTVDLRDGLHARASGECRAAKDAGALADSLRGLLSLARMSVSPKRPDLQRAFDAIQLRQDGRSVNVTIDLPEDLAERLAGQ